MACRNAYYCLLLAEINRFRKANKKARQSRLSWYLANNAKLVADIVRYAVEMRISLGFNPLDILEDQHQIYDLLRALPEHLALQLVGGMRTIPTTTFVDGSMVAVQNIPVPVAVALAKKLPKGKMQKEAKQAFKTQHIEVEW